MRIHYSLAFLAAGLAGSAAHAQQAPDSLVTLAAPAHYQVRSALDSLGQCTEVLSWGTPEALVRVFYPTGQLRSYVPFANLALGQRHGLSSSWFANGQAASLEPFEEGHRHGEVVCYDEDGRLRRRANFRAGTELYGASYDAAGQPLPYFPFEQPPLYPGGLAQLSKEIHQRLRWPYEMKYRPLFSDIVVYVSILITTDGRLREPQVDVPSREPALDQAVLQAVQQLSRSWQPGRLNGEVAAFRYRLPIEFRAQDWRRP
jgi:TonB family protein